MAIPSMLALFQSFQPGFREIDGSELSQLANSLFSTATGITALAGGGQTGATALTKMWNRVDTCATNSDSVMLMPAIPGAFQGVYNNTANTLAIFGQPTNPVTGVGDTIATSTSNTQQATGTGITLATTRFCILVCFVAGQWKQLLG